MTLDYPRPLVWRLEPGTWLCSAERPWGAVHMFFPSFRDAVDCALFEAMHNPIYKES